LDAAELLRDAAWLEELQPLASNGGEGRGSSGGGGGGGGGGSAKRKKKRR
jgi:hypothetical protein